MKVFKEEERLFPYNDALRYSTRTVEWEKLLMEWCCKVTLKASDYVDPKDCEENEENDIKLKDFCEKNYCVECGYEGHDKKECLVDPEIVDFGGKDLMLQA